MAVRVWLCRLVGLRGLCQSFATVVCGLMGTFPDLTFRLEGLLSRSNPNLSHRGVRPPHLPRSAPFSRALLCMLVRFVHVIIIRLPVQCLHHHCHVLLGSKWLVSHRIFHSYKLSVGSFYPSSPTFVSPNVNEIQISKLYALATLHVHL